MKIYTSRPPARHKAARVAWDLFQRAYSDKHGVPVEMRYAFMDYWVWVAEFANGEYEDVDALTVRSVVTGVNPLGRSGRSPGPATAVLPSHS
jgi:hypothetical protein